MFQHNRMFTDRDPGTGLMKWFFESREGVMGPFDSEKIANTELQRHIDYSKRNGIDGGRKLGLSDQAAKLELMSV